MPNIPQIYRDRIASSLVGTPGIDTSGQQLGQEIAQGAEAIAKPLWEVAIKQQNMKDEAAYNAGILQHRINMTQAYADIKVKYADNPEAAGPAFLEANKNSLDSITQSAANPRVKLMLSRGDPHMDAWAIRDVYTWQNQQEWENIKKGTVSTMDESGQRVATAASFPGATAESILSRIVPELAIGDSLGATVRASKHPEFADEITNKFKQSTAISALEGALASRQPWVANDLLKNPDFKALMPADDFLKYRDKVDQKIDALPATLEREKFLDDLHTHPEIIDQVYKGKLGSADIAALLKKGDISEKTADSLDKIASNTVAKVSPESIAPAKADLYDSASSLIDKLAKAPSEIVEKAGNGKIMLSANMKDLYKFQDDILSAQAKGLLTPDQGRTFMKDLYYPLVASVLKNHDTSFGKDSSAAITPQMVSKVAEFQTASKIIEGNLTRNGQKENLPNKVALYDAYFKAAETNLGQINSKTNAKWTPEQIAHAVVGEDIGKIVTNHATGKSFEIIGYYDDGEPNVKEINATK